MKCTRLDAVSAVGCGAFSNGECLHVSTCAPARDLAAEIDALKVQIEEGTSKWMPSISDAFAKMCDKMDALKKQSEAQESRQFINECAKAAMHGYQSRGLEEGEEVITMPALAKWAFNIAEAMDAERIRRQAKT